MARGLARRKWVLYLSTAAALAGARVALLAWVTAESGPQGAAVQASGAHAAGGSVCPGGLRVRV